MSLYQKINAAQNSKDIKAYLDCLHEDFVFIRHQSETRVSKSDWTPTLMSMMQSDALLFNIKDAFMKTTRSWSNTRS